MKDTSFSQFKPLTKVSNLDIQVLVQQQVLWFEVAMDDHVPMAVVDAWDDLLEESLRILFLQLQQEEGRHEMYSRISG